MPSIVRDLWRFSTASLSAHSGAWHSNPSERVSAW